MEVVYAKTMQEKRQFLRFKEELYRGDPHYVDTASFVLKDALYQKTAFTKGCKIQPVLIMEEGRTICECIFLYNEKLPYLQVSFFEAAREADAGVKLLLAEAKKYAKEQGLCEIVIGLNAHLSYGVGILTDGFEYKNSFDSLYNKRYYKEYFQGLRTQGLSTYYKEKTLAEKNWDFGNTGERTYRIEYADVKNMRKECERMRLLCEKTIAKTFLYYPTEKGHFYELMKDLLPFLKGENLLFAVDEKGEDVGFLFWHPDFNQMLKGGRKLSTLQILFGYLFHRKEIDTVKLNAIGALTPRATKELIVAFNQITGGKYKYAETNFVWDNNLRSTVLNRRFFGEPHRKYEVYFLNAND